MIVDDLPREFYEIIVERIPHIQAILDIEGVYLAGGLLRTLVSPTDELSPEQTDVDLFFRDELALLMTKELLEKTPYHQFYQCPEGKLASYVFLEGDAEKWKLQLVTVDFYGTMNELIDSFDFTVTMYATDGRLFVYGETSMQDTVDRHLVWNRITYPSSSLRRMMKYARKGYWMQEEDYNHFVAKIWEHHPDIRDERLVYVD